LEFLALFLANGTRAVQSNPLVRRVKSVESDEDGEKSDQCDECSVCDGQQPISLNTIIFHFLHILFDSSEPYPTYTLSTPIPPTHFPHAIQMLAEALMPFIDKNKNGQIDGSELKVSEVKCGG
jgi:hypothetical protein